MKAYLILEDGTTYCGTSVGAPAEVIAEIVFNTSMTGYLEILTDPSYCGQAVVFTYPLIGNYGICFDDMESKNIWPKAMIARNISDIPSNFRSENTLPNLLKKYHIPAISGIDTRALTKHLRTAGTMNGMITTKEYLQEDLPKLLMKIRGYKVTDGVRMTTAKEAEEYAPTAPSIGKRVALYDMGEKENILRSLRARGITVKNFPATASAKEILAYRPDGIMISNGPGDPKDNFHVIQELKEIYASDVPVFAICLGHQLMALATGADTYKLPYGHRGANHPVKDLETGRVYITSQNHGYAVDMNTVDPKVAVAAYENVNDKTNEGLRYVDRNILTVQFHPEASPGPKDTEGLFDRFVEMMEAQHAGSFY